VLVDLKGAFSSGRGVGGEEEGERESNCSGEGKERLVPMRNSRSRRQVVDEGPVMALGLVSWLPMAELSKPGLRSHHHIHIIT
jgi:hypothetical protein